MSGVSCRPGLSILSGCRRTGRPRRLFGEDVIGAYGALDVILRILSVLQAVGEREVGGTGRDGGWVAVGVFLGGWVVAGGRSRVAVCGRMHGGEGSANARHKYLPPA
ncbi:hypothetical protein E2C01_075722 [Portunus trituberculatus]|uniref:Uncharacterized protein n=1 Tax=Portunus trituberculatus TaxID=210409 RepID=A0A5B7I6T8_PORTR|nr:hypothetical protein [Portunus trituberculatus]